MTVKKITRLPLQICFCLSLVACQAPTLSPGAASEVPAVLPEAAPPTADARIDLSDALSGQQAEFFAGQLRIQGDTQDTLVWSPSLVNTPSSAASSFQVQGVRRSDISRLRLTVQGPGISPPLQTEAAVTGNTLPSLTLGPIPQGRFRVVQVVALDASGDVLPGFQSSAVYNSPASGAHTVSVKRLENPLARLVLRLIEEQPEALNTLDLEALRERLASLSGPRSGVNNDGGYAHDPDFVNADAIFDLFDFATLPVVMPDVTAMEGAALKAPAQLTLHLATENGKDFAEPLWVVLNHPTAAAQPFDVDISLGSVTFDRLFYGADGASDETYTLRVLSQAGTTYASLPVRIDASGNLTVDPQNTLSGANGATADQPLIVQGAAERTLTTYFVSPTGSNAADGRSAATAWQTIQHAVDTASSGSRIEIAAGEYHEEVSVNKVLTLVGAGSGPDASSASHLIAPTPTSGSGFALGGIGNSDAETLTLSGMRIRDFNYGVAFAGQHIRLEDLTIRDTGVALRLSSMADMQHLTVHNSTIEANDFGFYAAKDNPHGSNLRYLTVTQTQFLGNRTKGLYFEKLSDALFDGITLTNNGNRSDYAFNAGLELNLKWKWGASEDQDYANITIQNSTFTGNGVLGTASHRMNPVSIALKARDDAPSYNNTGKPPAALSNVRLENNTISAPVNAVRIGETAKNSAGTTGVVLVNNALSLEGSDALARYLLNNQTTVNVDASSENTFAGLEPNATNGFAVEALLFDQNDQAGLGRVSTGLPAGQTFVPYHSDGSLIQNIIDQATAGDVITLQDGTYNMDARTLNLNQAITLQGQSTNTVLEQDYVVSTSTRLINVTAAGATLRQMHIDKTNKAGPHNLIQVTANNVTLEDLWVTGQFANGDGDTSRAFEIGGGLSGLRVQNNTIGALRQPAYINPGTTGTIQGNRVYGTRGWVVDGARMTFVNTNTWRSDGQATTLTEPSENFGCDVALLNDGDMDYLNFYGGPGDLENTLGDLLPAGAGMAGCDQRVIP